MSEKLEVSYLAIQDSFIVTTHVYVQFFFKLWRTSQFFYPDCFAIELNFLGAIYSIIGQLLQLNLILTMK